MKRTNLEVAAGLARKAESDWTVVCRGLEQDFPLDAICFHIQQAAEKLLKALLVSRGVDFPFTHDLEDLVSRITPEFPELQDYSDSLSEHTQYAVGMRYDDSICPTREDAVAAAETVRRLRTLVHALLPPEARP
ncbi:MAG: HEPN domain-containing protein [Acidobacteria bacterium]|nr:HEPN domain-containing protein [Acidobacteriota bacterium]